MADLEVSVGVGHRKVWGLNSDNNRAHLRMNVAENVGDAGLRESYPARGSTLIEPKIERLPTVDREDVMEKRVLIGKFDFRSHPDRNDVGCEAFVFLDEASGRHGDCSRRRKNGAQP